MITVIKNNDRFVAAYILWDTVDKDGKNKNDGEYLFIYDLWVHPSWRLNTVLKDLIHLINIDPRSQFAHWVYWIREKYNRNSKVYSKDLITKEGVYYGGKREIGNTTTTATVCA